MILKGVQIQPVCQTGSIVLFILSMFRKNSIVIWSNVVVKIPHLGNFFTNKQCKIEIKITWRECVSANNTKQKLRNMLEIFFSSKTMQPFQFNLLVYRKKKKNLWPHVRVIEVLYQVTIIKISFKSLNSLKL